MKKLLSGLTFSRLKYFQYEIQHNLRSLIFMIFKQFENSLDNIKIYNYILLNYFEVKKYQFGLIFSRLYIFNMKFNTICDL